MFFDKGAKAIQERKNNLFNKGAQKPDNHAKKNNNLDTYLPLFKIINSKGIIELNVEPKAIKLLEDNIGKILEDPG